MSTLGIIGAGRFGLLVEDLAKATSCYDRFCFFDDTVEQDGKRVVGGFDDIEGHVERKTVDALSIAVGYKHFDARASLYGRFKGKIPFATLIHPSAVVSSSATLEEGVMIYSMANVEMGAVLKPNVTVFNQSSVTHEVTIGAHAFLSVGVAMGGGVAIGEHSFIGVNASLINDISIGSNCIVCSGTLLTKSIPNDTCVIGNPFRTIKKVTL